MEHFALYAIDDGVQEPETPDEDDDGIDESADDLALFSGGGEAIEDDDEPEPPYVRPPVRRTRVATVGLEEGRLTVLSAEPASAAAVAAAVADVNGRAKLTLKLPPGPGDEKFSINKVMVPRGDPRFLEAVQDTLRRWHGMELEAERP